MTQRLHPARSSLGQINRPRGKLMACSLFFISSAQSDFAILQVWL